MQRHAAIRAVFAETNLTAGAEELLGHSRLKVGSDELMAETLAKWEAGQDERRERRDAVDQELLTDVLAEALAESYEDGDALSMEALKEVISEELTEVMAEIDTADAMEALLSGTASDAALTAEQHALEAMLPSMPSVPKEVVGHVVRVVPLEEELKAVVKVRAGVEGAECAAVSGCRKRDLIARWAAHFGVQLRQLLLHKGAHNMPCSSRVAEARSTRAATQAEKAATRAAEAKAVRAAMAMALASEKAEDAIAAAVLTQAPVMESLMAEAEAAELEAAEAEATLDRARLEATEAAARAREARAAVKRALRRAAEVAKAEDDRAKMDQLLGRPPVVFDS